MAGFGSLLHYTVIMTKKILQTLDFFAHLYFLDCSVSLLSVMTQKDSLSGRGIVRSLPSVTVHLVWTGPDWTWTGPDWIWPGPGSTCKKSTLISSHTKNFQLLLCGHSALALVPRQ